MTEMQKRNWWIDPAICRLGRVARWRRSWWLSPLALLLPLLLAAAWSRGPVAAEPGLAVAARAGVDSALDSAVSRGLAQLTARAERAAALWAGVEEYIEREVAPIERVLREYRDDPALTRQVARALVAEARRVGVEPRLLLAVLLVENPMLDPEARSPVGAVGLMQVMPAHAGNWAPCGPDLTAIEDNICYGARIFTHYFERAGGDVERALLRYNGCVRGTNTPDCHLYPSRIYARAGRASILAWLRPAAARAASP